MKRRLAWLLTLALILTSLFGMTEAGAEAPSLLPGVHITWDDTPETIEAKLNEKVYVNDRGTLTTSYNYGGLRYALICEFKAGRMTGLTLFTDAIGDKEYRQSCASYYDALVEGVEGLVGPNAPVKVSDQWKNTSFEFLYGDGDLSMPIYEGLLTRQSVYYGEYATYTTSILVIDDTLNIGCVVEQPRLYTGVWSEKQYSDSDGTYIISTAATGKSARLGTAESALSVKIGVYAYSNTHELYVAFNMDKNEHTKAFSNTTSEPTFNVVVEDRNGVTHRFTGVLQPRSTRVFVDENVDELIGILLKGGKISFKLTAPGFNTDIHTFTLENADGLSSLYGPWREKTPSYGEWILKTYTDSDRSYIVSNKMTGSFSNSATNGSRLSAYVFCQDFSDSHENFIILRMFEYEEYKVDNIFSDTDYYTIYVTDKDGVRTTVSGYIPGKDADIRITGRDGQKVIDALCKGGRVSFYVQHDDYSHTHYFFYVDADGFATIYGDWK